MWSLADFALEKKLRGHDGPVRGLVFSSDGTGLFSAGEDGLLKIWDVTTGKERKSIKVTPSVQPNEDNSILALSLSPSGKTLLIGEQRGNFQILSADDLKGLYSQSAHAGGVNAIVYGVGGQQFYTLGVDQTLKRWDGVPSPVREFVGHKGPVRSAVFSPDGKLILSGGGWPDGDKTLRLWEVATGKAIRQFEGIDAQINAVAFAPDGKHVVAGLENGKLSMWAIDSGKRVREFEGHKDGIPCITFSRDGSKMLSASHDKTVRLWDTSNGESIQVFRGHTDWVRSAVFLPDEKRILSGGRDKTVRLWQLNGKHLKTLDHAEDVESLACLADGKRCLSGGGQVMRLWDIDSGRTLQQFVGHVYGITSLSLSRNERTVLTASYDGSTRLWEVETGDELHRFGHHREWVWSVMWAPDGKHFMTAGGGGSVNGKFVAGADFGIRLWRMPARLLEVR